MRAGVDTEEAQLAHEGVGGMILKARAEKGSSSEEWRTSSSSVSGLMPLMAGMSVGAGI